MGPDRRARKAGAATGLIVSQWKRNAAAVLLVAVAGWLTSRAYPDAGLSALAWIALVPFFVCVRGSTPRAALVLGAVWMLCFAWGINDWFPRAVARYLDQPYFVGILFFLGVTLGSAAPATMGFALYYRLWGTRSSLAAPVFAAAAWVAGEFFRARVLGDPWGLLGYSQAARLEWIQIADVTGVYGVSFLVVLVNAVVAELLLGAAGRTLTRRLVAGCVALVVLAPALTLAYGRLRLETPARPTAGAALDVVVVQGNLALESGWREDTQEPNLRHYLALTERALAAGRTSLVVWPENAVNFLLDDAAGLRARIASTLASSGAALVTGGPHAVRAAVPVYYNSAFLIAPDGTIRDRYDKQRLLPFGEFQPVARFGLVASRFERVREFSRGASAATTFEWSGVRLGTIICNEAMFPEPAGERVASGAQVLLVLTNDSWVGERKFAAQAFDKARLRAVEQRRWLVRASTSGPSAIVDAAGRVVVRTRDGEEAILRGKVERTSETTAYAAFGDAFAWACLLAVSARIATRQWTRRKPS